MLCIVMQVDQKVLEHEKKMEDAVKRFGQLAMVEQTDASVVQIMLSECLLTFQLTTLSLKTVFRENVNKGLISILLSSMSDHPSIRVMIDA